MNLMRGAKALRSVMAQFPPESEICGNRNLRRVDGGILAPACCAQPCTKYSIASELQFQLEATAVNR